MGKRVREIDEQLFQNELEDEDAVEVQNQSSDSQGEGETEVMDNLPVLIDIEDLRRTYLDDITQTPLLTAEEEVSLTRSLQRGRKARKELLAGNADQKRWTELNAIIEAGSAARERLLMANTRLVVSVAKKYRYRGLPFIDLVQEGIIGLIRATTKYDPDRGTRFSTYATWWIRQAITRTIDNHARTIRLPVHKKTEINRLNYARHQLSQDLGREPTVEELAEILEKTSEEVRETIKISQHPLSLETPQDDEDGRLLADMLPDDEAQSPEDAAETSMIQDQVREILEDLSPREAKVIKLRYGLQDGQTYALQQVGDRMGITRERVRQIESQALSRLRNNAKAFS